MSFQKAYNSLARVADGLNRTLVDRQIEIQLAVLALVARQHLFLLGPPGTGKSYLANMVAVAADDPNYFQILLTRFTDPAEVFGPLDVREFFEKSISRRKTDGYMPVSRVCFADEIWKASSAILNSLLTIINEREFDNGGKRHKVPLETLFAASNELPQDDGLAALYDRFLLRHEVLPVSTPQHQAELLVPRPPFAEKIEHLDLLQAAVSKVDLSADMAQRMLGLRAALRQTGIVVGDRRFQQSASLIRAAAVLQQRTQAEPADLWPLAYCFWQTPDQIATVRRIVDQARTAAAAPQQQAQAAAPPPSGHAFKRPAAAPKPQAPAVPTATPTMTWQEIAAIVARSSVADNSTNKALHEAIEALIPTAVGQQRSSLESWKASIRANSGGVWLA